MNEISGTECVPTGANELRQPSLTESMRQRKARLEAELAQVNSVLVKLEASPATAELLDDISRLGGLRGY